MTRTVSQLDEIRRPRVVGFAVLGQTLTPAQLAGAGLVLTTIWIGQRPDPNEPPATAPTTSDPTASSAAATAALGCCR